MAKKGDPKKKKKPAMGNGTRSRAESKRVRELIFQDLCIGIPLYEIAERVGCHATTVYRVQEERREDLEAFIQKQLAARQQKIDKFLDGEQDSLIEVCEQSSAMLKQAIVKHQERLTQGLAVTKEIRRKTEDGKFVKEVMADDLDTLVSAWERIHSVFTRLQRSSGDA